MPCFWVWVFVLVRPVSREQGVLIVLCCVVLCCRSVVCYHYRNVLSFFKKLGGDDSTLWSTFHAAASDLSDTDSVGGGMSRRPLSEFMQFWKG